MTPAMFNVSCRSAVSGNNLGVPIPADATVRDLRRRLYCQLYADDPSMEGREQQIHLLSDQGPLSDAERVEPKRTYQYLIVTADVAEDLEAIKRTMSLFYKCVWRQIIYIYINYFLGRWRDTLGSQARRGLDGRGRPLVGPLL